ncbi:hypothetical protein K501DRAFT_329845 [Backusella circina FSU 941]|nr:hypothetical protein K501DRAFT_329845 [Backusella circina FSU 941]
MASITDTGDSWLRQKSSVFHSSNNNAKPAKVLDKELAQLKNRGVVSSVWSNKFVQNNNSSGENNSSSQLPPEPLSPFRRNVSPRPNAAYIPAAPGSRQTFDNYAAQIQQPTSPTFSSVLDKQRARTLSGTGRMAQDINTVLNKRNNSEPDNNLLHKLNNNSVSSLDLTEDDYADNRFSVNSSTTSTPRSTLTKEIVKPSSSTPVPSQLEKRDSMDTKAALWFEIETLKTRYAQSEARLNKANEDIDFYKRQLEFQSDSINDANTERDQSTTHLKALAEIIIKQDQLLVEYEDKLETLSSISNNNSDMVVDDLHKELEELYKRKNYMEGAISAMRGELEMSYSQMRLMMVVSTEIQNEFEAFKVKSELNFKETLDQKQLEHDEQVNQLQEQIRRFSSSDTMPKTSIVREIQPSSDNNTVELNNLRKQVEQLTKALKEKNDTISDIEVQLKTQKMDMESQLMVLNKTIVEKDSLLLEVMSQRNNSDISIIDHATISPPDSAYQSEKRYTDAESYTKAHLQFDEIRRYMASSDEEDDDEDYRQLHGQRSPVPQSPADSESSMMSSLSFESASEEKIAEIKHFSYTSVHSQSVVPRPISDVSTLDALAHDTTSKSLASFLAKENSTSSKWPMPPPTPPPSEPLPPVPPVPAAINIEHPVVVTTAVPPPRRGRSNTLARSDIPEISTSINTEISRTLTNFENQRPIAPPRKSKNTRDSLTLRSPTSSLSKHTKWMDDPEEEEEEEQWVNANQQWTAY